MKTAVDNEGAQNSIRARGTETGGHWKQYLNNTVEPVYVTPLLPIWQKFTQIAYPSSCRHGDLREIGYKHGAGQQLQGAPTRLDWENEVKATNSKYMNVFGLR